MISCPWLPQLEEFENYGNLWSKYEGALYDIFKTDFIINRPTFKGKNVSVRRYPMEHDKEEAFFHVTCQDYSKNNNRVPDLRRCERIRWISAFIKNYNSCDPSVCKECSGVKVWDEPYKNTKRVHLLLEEERYIVVLEQRENYYLLITAFYFDHEHALEKKLKHYMKFSSTEVQVCQE